MTGSIATCAHAGGAFGLIDEHAGVQIPGPGRFLSARGPFANTYRIPASMPSRG